MTAPVAIGRPTRAEVEAWVTERWENCLRLAAMKTGEDKAGWLEDAVYFEATLGMLQASKS